MHFAPMNMIRKSDLTTDFLACNFKATSILIDDATPFHCANGIPNFTNAKTGVIVLVHSVYLDAHDPSTCLDDLPTQLL